MDVLGQGWRWFGAGVAGAMLLLTPRTDLGGDDRGTTYFEVDEDEIPWSEVGIRDWMESDIPVYRVFISEVDSASRYSLMYDDEVQSRYTWREFDYLEDATGKRALDQMFEDHEDVLESVESLPDSLEAWNSLPGPVRASGYINLIMHEADRQDLHQYFADSMDTYKRMIAIGMSESFFDHRAVNEGEESRDIGFGQLSSYARDQLSEEDRFAEYQAKEFFNPRVNIAGMVRWFKVAAEEADGDSEIATKAYNEGLQSALRDSDAAEEYYRGVIEAEDRYTTMVKLVNDGLSFEVEPHHSEAWERAVRASELYQFWKDRRYSDDGGL